MTVSITWWAGLALRLATSPMAKEYSLWRKYQQGRSPQWLNKILGFTVIGSIWPTAFGREWCSIAGFPQQWHMADFTKNIKIGLLRIFSGKTNQLCCNYSHIIYHGSCKHDFATDYGGRTWNELFVSQSQNPLLSPMQLTLPTETGILLSVVSGIVGQT